MAKNIVRARLKGVQIKQGDKTYRDGDIIEVEEDYARTAHYFEYPIIEDPGDAVHSEGDNRKPAEVSEDLPADASTAS